MKGLEVSEQSQSLQEVSPIHWAGLWLSHLALVNRTHDTIHVHEESLLFDPVSGSAPEPERKVLRRSVLCTCDCFDDT